MKTTQPFSAALLLSLTLTALSACTFNPPSGATLRTQVSLAARSAGVTDLRQAERSDGGLNVTGRLGGNAFAASIPPNWNGETLLYAHGYNTPRAGAREWTPDPNVDLRNRTKDTGPLNSAYRQGYATGASAYAKVGYAVKEGVEATIALHGLFSKLGVRKQYIMGDSMGGNITVALVEKYPRAFVGALPMCGVMAGWRAELRYLLDFRVVYDYFTRATAYALPGNGNSLTLDPAYTQQAVNNSVGGLFAAAGKGDSLARGIIGQVAAVTGAQPDPISFIVPLSVTIDGLSDLLDTMGGIGYSNLGKVYRGSADDAGLNAGVQRLTASAASGAYLDAHYTPTGRFNTKMLSIHNLSDPLVPYLFQSEFAAIVDAAGNRRNLSQQVLDALPVNLADLSKSGPAHCYFSDRQITYAWDELRAWVDRGVRPADGLNITNVR